MKKSYKTIIVGAGPGGLRCAKILAEKGEDFILLERNSEIKRKICTGLWGLSKKTKHMKIPNYLLENKFNKVIVSTPYQKYELKLKKPYLAILNRKKLGGWMLKEAEKAGAKISFSSPVTKIGKNFVVSNNKKIYFDYLVGADGSNSIIRKFLKKPFKKIIAIQYWLKHKTKIPEFHLDAAKFGPWYAWITPRGDLTSVGTGAESKVIPFNKLKKNLDKFCKERKIDISQVQLEGHPINFVYSGHKFGNKFLVGDAGGFASGLLGEGIYFAMASGEDVAKTIVNKKHKPNLIEEVLDIKRTHELMLKDFLINKPLTEIQYELFVALLHLKFFDKEVIDILT